MSSYKRQFLIQSYQQQQQQQQQQQEDTPWLRYPDPQKSSNGHSRSSHTTTPSHNASSRSETHPTTGRLHHKRSSSKLLGSSQTSSNSHHTHSNNSSNASLPMSLASNSSSDSLAHNHPYHQQHHHQQQPRPFASTPNNNSKPRSLSEELSFATQNTNSSADDIHRSSNNNNTSSRHPYPSPITPSDLLSIPDLSASPSSASSSSSASSTTSLASPFPLQRARVDSGTAQKLRPSPLSINTNLNSSSTNASAFPFPQHQSPSSVSRGSTVVTEGGGLGSPCANLNMSSPSALGTPPLPRLTRSHTHSSSSSSSSSVSTCSNTSSPSSSTAPCSLLCRHSSSNGHCSHRHHNHHVHSSHRHSHRHSSSCHHHKHQPREHHPACHLHGSPSHRPDSKSDRAGPAPAPKGVLRFEDPPTPGHEGIGDMNLSASSLIDEAVVAGLPEPTPLHLDEMPMAIEKAPASTAVTIVGSTPTYGMGAYKAQRDQEEAAAESSLGLYSTAEPPKKRQRSAAAVLFGAAFETVIFTSAVALSAYQLLTGKGRQQGLQDDASTGIDGETGSAEGNNGATSADQSIAPIESAPVNIPTRTTHRHHQTIQGGHLLGKSLHHHHHHGRHQHHSGRSRHPKSGSSRHNRQNGHGLSASLPHSNPHEPDHPFYERAMIPPKRPNTGTEDNDPQFLRMEAQLSTLIAEGKRALSSRIQDHQ